jgi:hypothetical protein
MLFPRFQFDLHFPGEIIAGFCRHQQARVGPQMSVQLLQCFESNSASRA